MKLLARNSVMCLEKSAQDYQSNLATPANLALTSVILLIFFFKFFEQKHWDINKGHCPLEGDFTDHYSFGVN